jgi:hypothetical protein
VISFPYYHAITLPTEGCRVKLGPSKELPTGFHVEEAKSFPRSVNLSSVAVSLDAKNCRHELFYRPERPSALLIDFVEAL